jgi:hypothetical protein
MEQEQRAKQALGDANARYQIYRRRALSSPPAGIPLVAQAHARAPPKPPGAGRGRARGLLVGRWLLGWGESWELACWQPGPPPPWSSLALLAKRHKRGFPPEAGSGHWQPLATGQKLWALVALGHIKEAEEMEKWSQVPGARCQVPSFSRGAGGQLAAAGARCWRTSRSGGAWCAKQCAGHMPAAASRLVLLHPTAYRTPNAPCPLLFAVCWPLANTWAWTTPGV